MHQRGEKRTLHMLATLACDLLRPQAGQPRLAPKILGLGLIGRRVEYFAAQHHCGGDVADLAMPSQEHRLLQRHHVRIGGAAPENLATRMTSAGHAPDPTE